MKLLPYIFLLLAATGISSCEFYEEVEVPTYDVAFSSTAQVAESVEFQVMNAPDFMLFYSGEFGHQYKFRDRTEAEGTVLMSFNNAQKWGTGTNETGTLSVWASTDYDGSGNPEAVTNATWTDISDRFEIATAYDFAWTESGTADITNLANGKPIYFAFKFYSEDFKSEGNRQPEWRIDDFSITLETEGAPAPLTVATLDDPGWNPVDVQGVVDKWNESKWYYDTGKKVWRFRGQPSEYINEDWLITKAINLKAVAPDKGEPLKTYSTKLESFEHAYTTPGTYNITLVGKNETVYGSKEEVKEYTITISE